MDIVSHGLWGSIAFGRKSRSSFWLAFVIGMAPDLFSFGILWLAAVLGLSEKPDFSNGTPPESTIPQYVHYLYNVTHSFIVFLAVFFLIWLLLKRPLWDVIERLVRVERLRGRPARPRRLAGPLHRRSR